MRSTWGDEKLDVAHIQDEGQMTIGLPGSSSDLKVDDPPFEGVIAVFHGEGSSIQVPESSDALLRGVDGAIARVSGPGKSVPLLLGECLAFKVGSLVYVCHYIQGHQKEKRKRQKNWSFARIISISFLLHLFFVITAFISLPEQEEIEKQMWPERLLLEAKTETIKPPTQRKILVRKPSKEVSDGGSAETPKQAKKQKKRNRKVVSVQEREKRDRKVAMKAGLLGMLSDERVSNDNTAASVASIASAVSGLSATSPSSKGSAARVRGSATGKSGKSARGGSVGIGPLARVGEPGSSGDINLSKSGTGLRGSGLSFGQGDVRGGLSKAQIAVVMRRGLPRLKHCYEKELASTPGLAGKLVVKFIIAPDGRVAQAKIQKGSLKSTVVRSCVTQVMKTFRFPKPKGGGIVEVSYPLQFVSQ